MTKTLSLGTLFGHDSSAALIVDGTIVSAIAQERLDRKKHSGAFPVEAAKRVLDIGKLDIREVDALAVAWLPQDYIRMQYMETASKSSLRASNFLLPDLDRLAFMLDVPGEIAKRLSYRGPILHFPHHHCHLAHAFYTSEFDSAIGLSVDGLGEMATAVSSELGPRGFSNARVHGDYPHSLGLFYGAITEFLGWKFTSDEGIVMGLAPLGNPDARVPNGDQTYYEYLSSAVTCVEGQIHLDLPGVFDFFSQKNRWVSSNFRETMGLHREKDGPVSERDMNLAAAAQRVLEERLLDIVTDVAKERRPNLVYAGGVSLNCSANAVLRNSGLVSAMYVPAGSGDDGAAIGAAILAVGALEGSGVPAKNVQLEFSPRSTGWQAPHLGSRHVRDNRFRLGTTWTQEECNEALEASGLEASLLEVSWDRVVSMLAIGKIGALINGPSEFGARALGNRSIVSAPFPAEQKDVLNARVKFREWFRPFAPAVRCEDAEDYFEFTGESPYMLYAVQVRNDVREKIPAVVHVDGSARLQTVDEHSSPTLYTLLGHWKRATGVGVLINTSFNVKGQPIVESPIEAVNTFLGTNIDFLILEGSFLCK